jgi:hypothetical protein
MKKVLRSDPPKKDLEKEMKDNSGEYPLYPESEDIYNKFKKDTMLDPEEITKTGDIGNFNTGRNNYDIPGGDLDIPGSELDDEQENIGNEDEENNYYSIGGDDHNNLDEDKDEL